MMLTWNVVSFIFDVHLMQASLCGLVLDGDSTVFIVSDVRASSLARGHSHLTCNRHKCQ